MRKYASVPNVYLPPYWTYVFSKNFQIYRKKLQLASTCILSSALDCKPCIRFPVKTEQNPEYKEIRIQDKSARWDLYLPKRSIIVLSREARYDCTHGIDEKKRDYVSLPTDQVTSRPDTNSSDTSSRDSDGIWKDRRGTRLCYLSFFFLSVIIYSRCVDP